MADKVIVLGAAEGQIPLIKECQKRGLEVIAISVEGNYPGFEVADKTYYFDTRDKESILEVAKKEEVIAIMTDQTDVGVPTVAYIAEKLDLPGIGYETALKFNNKGIMREEASKLGVKVPAFHVVGSYEEARECIEKVGFPIMIKPVDNSGSKGVAKLNNYKDLDDNFENSISYSKTHKIILEQYITGTEYVIDGFANNGNYQNFVIGLCSVFDIPDTFISNRRLFVSAAIANDVEKRILAINKKIAEGFGLKNGITQAEYIYNPEEDEIYFIEIGARGGGVFISSHMAPLATGTNLVKLLVDYNTNTPLPNKEIKLNKGAAAYFCFTLPKGKIINIENKDQIINIPGVDTAYLDNIKIGMQTETIKDKTMRKGPILVYGKTRQDCLNTFQKIKETLKIEVQTSKGIQNIIWD